MNISLRESIDIVDKDGIQAKNADYPLFFDNPCFWPAYQRFKGYHLPIKDMS